MPGSTQPPAPIPASVLRRWAQSNGYVRDNSNPDGPETWIDVKSGSWRLKIKQGGVRPGLDPASQIPRASARNANGEYINPVTGEVGTRLLLGHIPVDLDR